MAGPLRSDSQGLNANSHCTVVLLPIINDYPLLVGVPFSNDPPAFLLAPLAFARQPQANLTISHKAGHNGNPEFDEVPFQSNGEGVPCGGAQSSRFWFSFSSCSRVMPKELQNTTWLRDSSAMWSDIVVATAEISSKIERVVPRSLAIATSIFGATESTGSSLTHVLLCSAWGNCSLA
jgi:hypothetical protein